MSYRNTVQFFHDSFVHTAIDRLAAIDQVVIDVGAGATIDQTGLGWRALIEDLLAREAFAKHGFSRDAAKIIANELSPIESATVAGHHYKLAHGPDWFANAETDLKSLLYSGEKWTAGRVCSNVVRLAVCLAELEKNVHIVTTNYETFLEQEYLDSEKLVAQGDPGAGYPRLVVDVLGQPSHELPMTCSPSGTISLTYLHGRIPLNGNTEGRIGLTEWDYFELRQPVLERLGPLISDAGLLILGSSLTDPPLLAALQATKPTEWNADESQRFALTPLPSYSFDRSDPSKVEVLKAQLRNRMDTFGVTLLYPDFYFQVAQFCEELIIALKQTPSEVSYSSSPNLRYGGRLRTWWSEWQQNHTDAEDARDAYTVLIDTLRDIRKLASTKPDVTHSDLEIFKLDVWVRWDPSESSRVLTRWASSTGIRRDFDSLQRVNLNVDAESEAVQALIGGVPRLRHDDDATSIDHEGPMWRTALSVPITYAPPRQGSIPVGVVVLSGSRGGGSSRVEVSDTVRMKDLVQKLKDCGSKLLGPGKPAAAEPLVVPREG